MILLLVVVFIFAFLLSLASIPPMIRLARRTGLLDHPGPRKIHTEPIPYGGGIAVAAGLLLPMILGGVGAYLHAHAVELPLPEDILKHVPGVLSQLPRLGMLVAASLVILLLGLVDDRYKIGAGMKLTVQVLVALGMALGYERLSLFTEGSTLGDVVGTIITVLWIVGVTNAFNLLDHMDGLAAGVAAIASACFLATAFFTQQYFIAAALASLLGACIAFLFFNFPPAKIFLGDAGSLLLGFVLATLTVSFTFFDARYPLYSYAVPLVVLAVPLYDTASVVWIRLRERRSPFDADTNHFAHRLVALGLAPRSAVLTIYSLTAVTGVAAILLYEVELAGAIAILGQILVIFVIISILETRGRSKT